MDAPHLPRQALIDAHGGGGFRFAGMSHRGSLLCLPDGIWAWPVATPEAVTDDALSMVFDRAGNLDFFILGTGARTAAHAGEVAAALSRGAYFGRCHGDSGGGAHLQRDADGEPARRRRPHRN